MAFIKKPASILVFGGSGVGVAQAAGGLGTSVTSPSEIEQSPKLEEFKQKLIPVDNFLKMGESAVEHSNLMKDYSLTLSGGKDFARILVGSLIMDMVDNLPSGKASAIKNNLKSKIDSLRNSSPAGDEEAKKETYRLYGGEDRYKAYQVLKEIRKIAIDQFTDYLPTVLSSSTNDLKGEQHGDDLIKDGFGVFYDHLLDDYLKYNKPIFVKRFAFEYSSDNIEDKVKSLLNSSELPSDFQYPNKAGYLFPYLKNKGKWDELKGKAEQISSETPSDSNSDDPKGGKMVIPLSIVDDPGQSSNFLISVLKLQGTNNSTSKLSDVKLIDESSSSSSSDVDDIKELKDNAIFFRDRTHIQVLVKDTSKDTDLKKHIIEASKNTSEGEYKFDLKGELRKWMEKHLERLFLEKWSEIKDKQSQLDSQLDSQLENWRDVASKLKDVLEVSFIRNSLVNLRKNVIKDYAELIRQYPPLKLGGQVKTNPILKFSGKLVSKVYSDSNKKLGEDELVFGDLETNFLSQKTGSGTIDTYNKKCDDAYKGYKEKLDELVKNKTSDLNTDKNEEKKDGVLYSFKGNSGTQAKALDVTNLFNNLWIHMIHGGLAEDYFLQKQTYDYLKKKFGINDSSDTNKNPYEAFNLLTSEAFKKNDFLKNIGQDLFKSGSITQDFSDVLFRRYMISKSVSALKGVPDPSVYAKDLLSQLSTLKDGGSFKDIVKKLHDKYDDGAHDLLSPFQKDVLAEMTTMEFLARDNFNNLRKLLKHKFKKNGSAAFLFTKNYGGNGLCGLDANNLETALDLKQDKVLEFKNEFLGHTDQKSWTPTNCLTRDEFFDFAILTADESFSNVSSKAGFKGLVFSDNYSDFVSPEIAVQMKKLPIWGNVNTIIKNISEVKTETAFSEILNSLKNSFPEVSWSFVEETRWIDPTADYRSRSFYASPLTLQQRKNILIGFLSQSTETVKDNSALDYKYNKQNEWARAKHSSDVTNSFLSTKLSRFSGFLEHQNSKVLLDKDNNPHLVYLIHVRYDDLQNMDSWKSFLKDISPDLLASELVKLAADKSLQKQVTYHLLNETKSGEGIAKLSVGDSRLREKLGVSWLTLT